MHDSVRKCNPTAFVLRSWPSHHLILHFLMNPLHLTALITYWNFFIIHMHISCTLVYSTICLCMILSVYQGKISGKAIPFPSVEQAGTPPPPLSSLMIMLLLVGPTGWNSLAFPETGFFTQALLEARVWGIWFMKWYIWISFRQFFSVIRVQRKNTNPFLLYIMIGPWIWWVFFNLGSFD